jgi:putative endonuclease
VSASWLKLGPEVRPTSSASAGERFERDAEALLKANGLTLIERNWLCRFGEIDLIMRDGATLVFVEVRQRNSQRFGGAAASIGSQKQARMERAIALYLSRLPTMPACRVDAVLFEGSRPAQWVRNIFDA